MTGKSKALRACALGVALATLTAAAWAHPGHIGHLHGEALAAGLMHPLTGFDHLFAMLAVGIWAALTHDNVRDALWSPISFAALLFIGALAGISGLTLPLMEPLIMASLLVLGLLVAARLRLPQWAGATLVGFFAFFHGLAHGSELPGSTETAWSFIVGFMITTALLHVAGMLFGFQIKRRDRWIARVAGGGIAAYGAALLLGA